MTYAQRALAAYWRQSNPDRREIEWLAYSAILLYGGIDGYPPGGGVRCWVARKLRQLALRIEGRRE